MPESVRIARGVLTQILDHAKSIPEQECCGLLAGRDDAITEYFPARNALSSSTAYEIAVAELFSLVREMRTQQLTLLGICHSHPHSANVPSITDIERAYYPDAAYFIISPELSAPRPVRAFHIRDGRVTELPIEAI